MTFPFSNIVPLYLLYLVPLALFPSVLLLLLVKRTILMPMTSKHDKSENELRHSSLFPCPSIPSLPCSSCGGQVFPSCQFGAAGEKGHSLQGRSPSQGRCGQGRLRSCCSDLRISPGAHGNTGLAQPDQFVPWLISRFSPGGTSRL